MAFNSKDRSRKDGAEKSSAKKASKTTSSAAKKSVGASTPADKSKDHKEKAKEPEAKTKASPKSATASKSVVKSVGKKTANKPELKKSSKSIRDFMSYLGNRYPSDQKILGRDEPVLDHVAFAIYLENGSFKQARRAFSEILKNFVDWNETRVSRTSEIAAVVGDIPKARQASEHLRWLLQSVFSVNYDFSLEGLRQQDEKSALERLRSLPVATRFVADYVERFALGGKEIPLSDGALRALRLLGFVKIDDDRERLDVKGRALTQEESRRLFFQLHELGAELKSDATRNEVLKFLKGFDKKVAERSEESTIFDDYSLYDSLLERYAEQTLKSAESKTAEENGVRDAAEAPNFDDPSVFDDEEEGYDPEGDDFDDSESVVETKMTSVETTFRDAAPKPAKSGGNRGVSSSSRLGANVRQASSDESSKEAPSKTSGKKSKGDLEGDSLKTSSKKTIATEQKTAASVSKKDAKSKNSRLVKAKKAEEEAVAKIASKKKLAGGAEKAAASRRGGVADASNVSASEPPDKRRKETERLAKASRSTSKSSNAVRDDESLSKGVKRTKTKDVSKKTSSRDASKLKEILRKKPR